MTTSTRAVTSATNAEWDSQHEAVADFVRRFEETWVEPDPDRINGLVHSDIEFSQPLEGPVHGHEEARAFWRRLFTLIPDIHGEVLSWGFGDGVVYIELRMVGTLGGKPIDWVTLDRIRLEDGKVRQRIAYFNPLPLVRAVVMRPRAWPRWLAAQRQRRS
jgi:ketosteroid isomerase-like protein